MSRCKLFFFFIGCALLTLCQADWTTSTPSLISATYTFTYAGVFNSCDPSSGIFFATWVDENNNQYPTYSMYTPGFGWSSINTISNLSSAVLQSNVQTSCNPASGQFLASWTDATTLQPTVAVYTSGSGWSAVDPLALTAAAVNTANSFDSIAEQFLVTWADTNNNNYPTYSFFTPGTGWGPIATISTDSEADNVYTAFDSTTNQFLAVWVDIRSGNPMYSFYNAGAWTAAALISPFASVDNDVLCACNPSTGQFFATWADINQNLYPFYSIYTPGSGWSPIATITTSSGVTDNVIISCDLTTGQFLASWSDVSTGYPSYSFYTPGTGWSDPEVISIFSTTGGDVFTSFNAMTGQFLATWADKSNPDLLFDPTYSFFTYIPPPRFAGSSSITTSGSNSSISIHAGGEFNMRTGMFYNTSAVINATGDDVTILAQGMFSTSAATSNFANNANVTINSGGNISLTGNGMAVLAGSAAHALVTITTTAGGNIDLNSSGAISLQGGSSNLQSTELSLLALKGGDINITGGAISFDAGTGDHAPVQIITGVAQGSGTITLSGSSITTTGYSAPSSNVMISTGSTNQGTINLDSTGGIFLTATSILTNAPVGANPITLTAGDNIALTNSSVKTNQGNASFFADGSISLDSTSLVNAGGNNALALFVVDSGNAMMSSGFSYPVGAQIMANKGTVGKGAVRIYTVGRSQNSVATDSTINGLLYIPGTEFVGTNQEYWNVTYPTVPPPSLATPRPDGTDHFTIYYMEGSAPPS